MPDTVTMPNGDTITLPDGLSSQRARTYALHAWQQLQAKPAPAPFHRGMGAGAAGVMPPPTAAPAKLTPEQIEQRREHPRGELSKAQAKRRVAKTVQQRVAEMPSVQTGPSPYARKQLTPSEVRKMGTGAPAIMQAHAMAARNKAFSESGGNLMEPVVPFFTEAGKEQPDTIMGGVRERLSQLPTAQNFATLAAASTLPGPLGKLVASMFAGQMLNSAAQTAADKKAWKQEPHKQLGRLAADVGMAGMALHGLKGGEAHAARPAELTDAAGEGQATGAARPSSMSRAVAETKRQAKAAGISPPEETPVRRPVRPADETKGPGVGKGAPVPKKPVQTKGGEHGAVQEQVSGPRDARQVQQRGNQPEGVQGVRPGHEAQGGRVQEPAGKGQAQQEAVKPPWEMNPDELEHARASEKGKQAQVEAQLFGVEGAKRYAQLQRIANSTMRPFAETKKASDEVERMEAKLTPEQQNRLFGVGDETPDAEELRDYHRALTGLDWDSPQALGQSLRFAVTKIGEKSDPADMTHSERVGYATLRYAMEEAQKKGWNTKEISDAALGAAADRFTHPNDALFMMRRFLKPQGEPPPPSRAEPKAIASRQEGRPAQESTGPQVVNQPRSAREGLRLLFDNQAQAVAHAKPGETIAPIIGEGNEGKWGVFRPEGAREPRPPDPMKAYQTSTRARLPKAPPGSHTGAITLPQSAVDAVHRAVQTTHTLTDEVRKGVAPAGRTPQAASTALLIRKASGTLARYRGQVHQSFKALKAAFDKMPETERIAFMQRIDEGQAQPSADLQQAADYLKGWLSAIRDEVRAVRPDQLKVDNPDYFPRRYKAKPGTPPTGRDATAAFGRRPIQGTKTALRGRTYQTLADALAAGHELESTNPVDLVEAHLYDMKRYVEANKLWPDLKAQRLIRFNRAGRRIPDGYARVEDPIATVYAARGSQGEMRIRGEWIAPEPVARVFNNYLRPGWNGHPLYEFPRAVGNTLNMAQLGLSAFHLTSTGLIAHMSKMALGIEQLSRGKFVDAGKSFLSLPATSIGRLWEGNKVLKEYYQPRGPSPYAPNSPEVQIANIVHGYMESGGRGKMDSFYHNNAVGQFLEAWRGKQPVRVGYKAIPAAIEGGSSFVMQWWVPRIKAGVFADMARAELDRLGPSASPDAVRRALAATQDSVDNRLGQMVYDNLFWDRTIKDMAMLGTRSLGWNLGTFRELLGGVSDTTTIRARLRAGDPAVTQRMAFTVALPVTTALVGTMMGYAYGQPPQNLKDRFFPRTGRLKPDGTPERISLPAYMKDVAAYMIQPGATIAGKVHPMWSDLSDMLHNEDFYGKPIRNADDPLVQQVGQLLAFHAKQYVPIAFRNQKGADSPYGVDAARFFGLTPAPSYINKPGQQYRTVRIPVGGSKGGGRASGNLMPSDKGGLLQDSGGLMPK